MLNEEQIVQDLADWMKDFVEKPNPLLNNWAPCPYARQARIADKIAIIFSDHLKLTSTVEKNLSLLEDKDVFIICFDHTAISADEISELVKTHNKLLMKKDVVVLEDHPDSIEMLNGVEMNFGKCGLLLVQKLSKLSIASDQLREKGYYDNWPKENYLDVVAWRQQ